MTKVRAFYLKLGSRENIKKITMSFPTIPGNLEGLNPSTRIIQYSSYIWLYTDGLKKKSKRMLNKCYNIYLKQFCSETTMFCLVRNYVSLESVKYTLQHYVQLYATIAIGYNIQCFFTTFKFMKLSIFRVFTEAKKKLYLLYMFA